MTGSDLVNHITRTIEKAQAAIFCGAGISSGAGIPPVREFVPYVLNMLSLNQYEVSVYLEANPPFEAFMETLQEAHDIDRLLGIFKGGEPRLPHMFLAKLIQSGRLRTICTTNFDTLLEDALVEEQLQEGRDFDVIFRSDQMAHVTLEDKRRRIIKIHGSIADKTDIATTIRQVASKRLVTPRLRVIDQIFATGAHHVVLVMGYSCSDKFDLTPAIEDLDGTSKEIILVKHTQNISPDRGHVEHIALADQKNPFRHFTKGYRFFCDTNQLLRILWLRLHGPNVPEPEEHRDVGEGERIRWKDLVNGWFSELVARTSNVAIPNINGWLFGKIGKYSIAEKYFREAVKEADKENHRQGKATNLSNLGAILLVRGKFEEGRSFLQEALSLSRSIPDVNAEIRALINLAQCNMYSAKFDDALQDVQTAREGLQYTNYPDAEHMLDIIHGMVLFLMGNQESGTRTLERTLPQIKDDGSSELEYGILMARGILLMQLDPGKAIGFFEQAHRIAENLSHWTLAAWIRGYIGLCFHHIRDDTKAKKHLQPSIDYLQQLHLPEDHPILHRLCAALQGSSKLPT